MYRDIPEELRSLIEPVVADHGFELVDVETSASQGPRLLRVTIDTPSGDGCVPVGRCAEVSREIATQLEAGDAIPSSYRLEVSSPGLDRHLGREKDFAAACGQNVRIETQRPLDGRRRFQGRLLGFEDGLSLIHLRRFRRPTLWMSGCAPYP